MGVIKWKKFSDNQLKEILDNNTTFKGALMDLGYNTQSVNNKIIKEIAEYLNYDLSSYVRGRKIENLIGLVYGDLTIIEIDVEKSKEKKRTWVKAQCSCGEVISVSHNALQRGNTKTCGHSNLLRENIIGKRYGRWTVIEYIEDRNHKPYYLCKCNCGTEREICRDYLVNGTSQSCGCLQKEIVAKNNFIDLTGQTFGKLKVLELHEEKTEEKGMSIWKCLCECGNISFVRTADLKNKNTQSCGCHRISKGELCIKEILIRNNINFCEQFTFNDLKGDKKSLKFDFGIFNEKNELSYLIEYNGIQHYEPVEYFGGADKFQKQQKYDLQKKEYCSMRNIPLIVIDYKQEITDEIVIRKEYLC